MRFKSFVELGTYMGIKPKEHREKVKTCRKCGGRMQRVGNSNVYVCHGQVTFVDNDGLERKEPCNNRFIMPVKHEHPVFI